MTRAYTSERRNIERGIPDPFPVHKLKRVDRPTITIHEDQIARVDEREGGFQRAIRGDYGPRLQKEFGHFMFKYPLAAALLSMSKRLAEAVDGPVGPQPAPSTDDPAAMARHIKEAAYFLRADLVGICKLPSYAVFSHSGHDGQPIELDHKYAIGILIDQDWRTAAASTGTDWIGNSMSFLSYSTSGFVACILAEYIRRLGYPARAHHAMNYQVTVPPLLLWAGLGEVSRLGEAVLNPFLGTRFKAAVVTTDLPLAVDKPIDFGLQDFCAKCKKCAEKCPSQAISYGDKVLRNGYERWPLDVKKCTSMRVGNQHGSGCGACIKACPWNKPFTPLHRFVNWMVRSVPASRRLVVRADDWAGYGRPKKEWKWWLDIEDMGGEWRTPRTRKSNEE